MEKLASPEFRSRVETFQARHETKVVTMLFSDIVGSTQLKAKVGDKEGIKAILRHHDVFRECLSLFHEAEEIGTAGDSFFVAFAKPSDAVKFALIVQKTLRHLASESECRVLDRIGIHVGEVWIDHSEGSSRSIDLYGIQVDLCARVSSLGDADQILLTRFPFDSARQIISSDDVKTFALLSWLNHGAYLLKGVEEPIEVCEVGEVGLARLTPPADSDKASRYVSADAEPVLGWRPAVGQQIPETAWVLEEKLGEGGFGEVWCGRDRVLKTKHVFKFCFRAERVRALKREVTIFRLLKERVGNHPNIVAIENVNFDRPPFYVVMQHVNGRDLAAWFGDPNAGKDISLDLRLRLVSQVADALQAAHDSGIVHRDVKPSNVLVSGSADKSHAYLTDFGLGNITSEAATAGITQLGFSQTITRAVAAGGTQLYMAPELFMGQPPSIRSDIYSIGVVLYQMIIGDLTRPVFSDWPDDIPDPLLREDLQLCFARDPLKRFSGAGELASRLRSLPKRRVAREQEHKAILARENARYHRGVVWTAAVEAPLIATVIAYFLYFTDDASGKYDFAGSYHIPLYLFFTALTAMYFGIDSGMRAYFRDLATGFTTAGHGVLRYAGRLFLAISGIIAIQTLLFVFVGNSILEVREMIWTYFTITFLIAFCGATLGLLFSSLVRSRESAVRILFLLIIPQMLLSGALIPIDQMNHLNFTFRPWIVPFPGSELGEQRIRERQNVPIYANFLPVRWGWEALMVAQAKLNPVAVRQGKLQQQIDALVGKEQLTEAESGRLEDLKDTLGLLSALEAGSINEIEKHLRGVDKVIKGEALDSGAVRGSTKGVTAERLYFNRKVLDAIYRSEVEQSDHRVAQSVNVLLAPEKQWEISLFGLRQSIHIDSLIYNAFALAGLSFLVLACFCAHLKLRVVPFMKPQKPSKPQLESIPSKLSGSMSAITSKRPSRAKTR